MGFMNWVRKRTTVDPTDISTSSSSFVTFVAPPEQEPPEAELDALRTAAAAHAELRSIYAFRDGRRSDPETLVVGVLLDDAVDDERMRTIVQDLAARVRPEDWGAQRIAVEPIGADLLEEADAAVGPLFERPPRGL
jgi:hypothetical protein